MKRLTLATLVATLVTLVVIALGYYLWRAYRAPFDALERELQALKEAGEPLRYEDIVTPIPANLNSAPIYQKAFGLLPKLSFNEWQLLDEFREGRPVEIARVRQILKRCQPTLALAKKASKLPHARWIKWQPNPFSIEFWHLLKLREVARLLVADTLLRLHDGDVEGSIENLAALLRMTHQMSDEPFAGNLGYVGLFFPLCQPSPSSHSESTGEDFAVPDKTTAASFQSMGRRPIAHPPPTVDVSGVHRLL